MKLTKIVILNLFVIIATAFFGYSQQGTVVSGGEATGPGGTMSFSTGQTDFMFFAGETGSIHFGLQQVFIIDYHEGVPADRFLITDNLLQGDDQCFDAYETIVLAGAEKSFIVENETGVDLIAGHSILMLEGTAVKHGGYMHARITSANGPFCDDADRILAVIPRIEPTPDQPTQNEHNDGAEDAHDDATIQFFKVYPNPTTGSFTVEILDHDLLGALITIEILGMRGEIVKRINEISHLQHQLSLKDKKPGLYMIRVQGGLHLGTHRIIKR